MILYIAFEMRYVYLNTKIFISLFDIWAAVIDFGVAPLQIQQRIASI